MAKYKRASKRTGQGNDEQVIAPKLEALEQINFNAAGLDIGDDEIYVAVPEGRDEVSVKVFKTFTADLYRLADWLTACGVDTVAMESTGVYWIPIYEILEERRFEVFLVNARHIKNVSGRKTDILDCQWIQQLHTYGLLRASFIPPDQIRCMRDLVRHRHSLTESCSREIQHMQKALQQMNLKLTKVLSDVTGETGQKIIRAIIAGERDPKTLASFRNTHCAKSEAEIAEALTGHYKPEQVFMLKQAVQAYDFFGQQIQTCDAELEKRYAALPPRTEDPDKPLPPSKRTKRKAGRHEPPFDLRRHLFHMAGVDLTQIDGLDILTIQEILTHTGTDMSPWPTMKHFSSWLSLCPHNDITGGKIIKAATKKNQNRAAAAFRMAARSLMHSQSALGAYCRHMIAKLGKPQGITATAHKLSRIFYSMLKHGTEYRAQDPDEYDQQVRERTIKNLTRKAKQLGFELVPSTT